MLNSTQQEGPRGDPQAPGPSHRGCALALIALTALCFSLATACVTIAFERPPFEVFASSGSVFVAIATLSLGVWVAVRNPGSQP